ncbi:MAG: asparagine synthase (glutamine-hydrolyzing) [Spirochaetes bacterium]|nr:asparagine synthase (glutamine-hydrolyzing) [Spirochaetota bacterium]
MCGICGIYNVRTGRPADAALLRRMNDALLHRGPDEDGYHLDGAIGLGHRRLSIIDLSGGRQPIYNEDRSLCVIFNGEIFNYIELREELEKKGHVFATKSDTEVIVHLYEERGKGFLEPMVGQFAIALWDARNRELVLARDRVGIRPLFYAFLADGSLVFASEMKALFGHPALAPEIDPAGIDQVLTLWANVPPRTVFKGVSELAPGCWMSVSERGARTGRYWKPEFPGEREYGDRPVAWYVERVKELLYDAVTIRLRADVPVAAYLSGGIDSSIISSLVKRHHNNDLVTFSVAFHDGQFDERTHQRMMVDHLRTDHRMIEADYGAIGGAFHDVVRFAEKPMVRTAPSPLFLLAGLVRENGIKVVLTGEGADEVFGGYDIFKEDKIRRFWARDPESKLRPLLLQKLHPYIEKDPRAAAFWKMFFRKGMLDTENRYYSHLIRWNNTARLKDLFGDAWRHRFDEARVYDELAAYIDPDMGRWHPFCRAQYLEMISFMSGYLLSSQGDRMMMGRSVEGRFPFLDHRLIDFAATIPPKYKMMALDEKHILKAAYGDILPESIVRRVKQPYRAPISRCFINHPETVSASMLEPARVKAYGYFDPHAVGRLVTKLKKAEAKTPGERDDMAIAAVVSTQLLHHLFIEKSASAGA